MPNPGVAMAESGSVSTGGLRPCPSFWATPEADNEKNKAEKTNKTKNRLLWFSRSQDHQALVGQALLGSAVFSSISPLPQQIMSSDTSSLLHTSPIQHPSHLSRYCHTSYHFDTLLLHSFSMQHWDGLPNSQAQPINQGSHRARGCGEALDTKMF